MRVKLALSRTAQTFSALLRPFVIDLAIIWSPVLLVSDSANGFRGHSGFVCCPENFIERR
jgi:hypothetical protein